MKRMIGILSLLASATLLAQPAPPFATGLRAPMKIAFSRQGNLIVAEAGNGPNTGRISLVDRISGTRRTLIDGLPSAIFTGAAQPQPSGPSGLALQGTTLYVTIGNGDATVAGPIPTTEVPNPNRSSPILSSLLSIRADRVLDLVTGGFMLDRSQHDLLKSGSTVTLTSSSGEQLQLRLLVDFPDTFPVPRPDFPDNVNGSNPFGVVILGQTLYVVNASLNAILRVIDGSFATLSTFAKVANPTAVGPPQIDAVPDSIRLHGNRLFVTTLTGFPFPEGKAEVRVVETNSGSNESVITGLTSAIDVMPLGAEYLVLEFSRNQLGGQPGRLRMVRPGGAPVLVADNLITPTSMAVDHVSGDVFVTHLGPGTISRIGITASGAPSAVIAGIASAPGAFGSRFVTNAQLSNPTPFTISGRVVFHPAGASAQASDPSLSYTLTPFETKSYDDLVAAVGGSGLGSADIRASAGPAPVGVIRVVDDASSQKPSVQIPILDPALALRADGGGTLVTPHATNWRFNVGIRTLEEGATITITLRGSSGAVVATATRVYPPNYFIQAPLPELVGVTAGLNSAVSFAVTQGSAFIYGAGNENNGRGMTLQIANPISQ